jgi:Arc/MetJ-type ribon-helix-helix transcriptional regulator
MKSLTNLVVEHKGLSDGWPVLFSSMSFRTGTSPVSRIRHAVGHSPDYCNSTPPPTEIAGSMPFQVAGMSKRTVRLPAELDRKIEQAAAAQGFKSTSDFVRDALRSALEESKSLSAVEDAEQRMVAGLDRIARELRSVRRVQQAQFAFTETLVKVLLTCIPEPSSEVYSQAKARAMVRYSDFLKSVGKAIDGDSKAVLAIPNGQE